MTLSFSGDVDVAIIGGGASGLLVAIHLLQAAVRPLRLAVVEPRDALGQGAAYSTVHPEHLLNVIASRMSLFPDDPMHFCRFLAGEAVEGPSSAEAWATVFARRRDFGRYLRATLESVSTNAEVTWLRAEAIDIDVVDPATRCLLALASGDVVVCRAAVLATGNRARPLPLRPERISGAPRVTQAWDYEAVHCLPLDADVAILGSGLSMVDVVVSLANRGHRGNITVLSRHGLMPLPHAAAGEQNGRVDELMGLSLRRRLRAIRDRAANAMAAGEPWQWTMDRLRQHVQGLWTSLDAADQRRFLRHGARHWDIHRHRIAPEVAAIVDGLRASGQLRVRAGHLSSLSESVGKTTVRYRPKGRFGDEAVVVDAIVNGTGVESNIRRTPSPLFAALLARGTIAPGPHAIGMATDPLGRLVDSGGVANERLFTLGAARIGSLWESIAIPELRGQAQRIAECVLGELAVPAGESA
jgi:uncharacterized NAD(P)/FAD-binding protein YdhS